LNIIQSSNNRD